MSEIPSSDTDSQYVPEGGAGEARSVPRPFGWAARDASQYAQPVPNPYAQPVPNPYAQPVPNPYAQPVPNPYAQPTPQPLPPQQPYGITPQYGATPPGAPPSAVAGYPAGAIPPWGAPPQPPPPRRSKAGLIIIVVIIIAVFGAGVGLIAAGTGKPAREARPLADGDVDRLSSGLQSSVVGVGGKACSYVASGSGFFVSYDLVVTNAHVVAGMKDPQVHTYSGVSFDAKAVVFDPDNDIAILKIDSPDRIPMSLADFEPPEGEGVVALGYPEAGPYNASPGRVTMILNAQGESIYGKTTPRQKHIILDIQVRPGNSGGPVVDRDGVVLGIVTAKSVVSKTNGIAVPAATIRRDLERAKSDGLPVVGTGSCMA